MSDYKPITGELRDAMYPLGWVETDGSITFASTQSSIDAEQSLAILGSDFARRCDAIDAIHAQLERENAALKAELNRVLGEQEEHRHSIGEVTVTIKPTLDWSGVAQELRVIADTFAFSHHHAPTVEDVLREMLDAWGELPAEATNEAIVAEYAAKLRLAEREDA